MTALQSLAQHTQAYLALLLNRPSPPPLTARDHPDPLIASTHII
jgi:hypothetical protein